MKSQISGLFSTPEEAKSVRHAIDPSEFKSLEELNAQLPGILAAAPKAEGRLDLIVVRPEEGLPGDHWISGSGYALEDGSGDPDTQICMMMSERIQHWNCFATGC